MWLQEENEEEALAKLDLVVLSGFFCASPRTEELQAGLAPEASPHYTPGADASAVQAHSTVRGCSSRVELAFSSWGSQRWQVYMGSSTLGPGLAIWPPSQLQNHVSKVTDPW